MDRDVLEKRYQILEDIFGNTFYDRKKDEVLIFCPKHHHRMRKLSVNVRKNAFRCWVCNYSGRKIFFLLREYANQEQRREYLKTLGIDLENTIEKIQRLDLPKEFKFSLKFQTPVGMMVEKYLFDDLNLTKDVVLQNKIGFCEDGFYSNRILFPSFCEKGELNYFLTRRVDGQDYKKYLDCSTEKKNIIYNEIFIDWSKPIIIVESVKTYLKHFSVSNVVPIMGSSLNKDYKLFQDIVLKGCDKVFVMLDPEAKIKSMNIVKKMISYGINAQFVDSEKRADEMGTLEFIDELKKARFLTKDDLIIEKLMEI